MRLPQASQQPASWSGSIGSPTWPQAMQIAGQWRTRLRDPGRAILAYERVLELLPQPDDEDQDSVAREARRVVGQAMDAMRELHAEASDSQQVISVGAQRLQLALGEPIRAAMILLELASVHEEKLKDARSGFTLRRQAHDIAPEMVTLQSLSEVAGFLPFKIGRRAP